MVGRARAEERSRFTSDPATSWLCDPSRVLGGKWCGENEATITDKSCLLVMVGHVLKEEGVGRKASDNPKSQGSHKRTPCGSDKGFYVDVAEGDCAVRNFPSDRE